MKTKIFTLMFASVLAMLFIVSGVSAALSVSPTTLSINGFEGASQTFTITNNETTDVDINLNSLTITDSDGDEATIDFSPSTITLNDNSTQITATVTSIDKDFNPGTFSRNYMITEDGNSANNVTLTISLVNSLCEFENPGELKVEIDSIEVTSGFGDDEEWLIMDEIEIEFEVVNDGDWDIEDIELEWGIINDAGDEWMIELDEIEEFDLDEGDEETYTVTFKIDDSDLDLDLDELENSYNVVVRATGQIDDSDSQYDGNYTCASDSEGVSIEKEDDFVIVSDIEVENSATCGENIRITADVWNIGEDDQDDVSVKISNSELGISELVEFPEIEAYERETLNLLIEIPEDADEKQYIFTVEVYDEDNDIYENDYDDEESRETFIVSVENCQVTSEVVVTASLTSGGKAGEQLVITSTLTNADDDTKTYTVNAAGYTGWANSVDISPQTVIVDSGNSKQVMFTFDVKNTASGSNSFDIEVISQGQIIMTQPVQVQIQKSGFDLFGDTVSAPYAIAGAILAILILIAIIVLIIRLVK